MPIFHQLARISVMLMILCISPSTLADGIFIYASNQQTPSASDQIIAYLIAGFSLGIIIYSGIIFWCTRNKIYLHFAAALFCYIIAAGQVNYLWRINPWPSHSMLTLIDALNLVLFASFIKHFLTLFVDFKRAHTVIAFAMDTYIVLGIVVFLSYLVFPHPVFNTIINGVIALSCLTLVFTLPICLPTVKQLRTFIVTQILFCLVHAYCYIVRLTTDEQITLPICNLSFFSSALLFLAFSFLIANDRKQKETAQHNAYNHLKKYQLLYQNAQEGLFSTHTDGRLLTANPALMHLLALPEKLLTTNDQPLYLQAYFATSQKRWDTLMRQLTKQDAIASFDLQGQDDTWYSLSVHRIRSGDTVLLEGSLIDITQRKQQELQLRYLANHDPLTTLYNRSEFENHLQDAVSSQGLHTLLFIDLDQFKVINDTCGHAAGDECLRQLSTLLKQASGTHNMLARLGGDEFGIVFWDQALTEGKASAERLRQALDANHFHWLQRLFKTTVSIGLVSLDSAINSGAHALSLADAACYEAKNAGRNRIIVNHPNNHTTLYRHSQMDMVATLTEALQDQKFVLFRQAIVPISTHPTALQHHEILLRLHTESGLLSPGAFLPAAQCYNMMEQIDRWVFNRTCQWLAEADNMAKTDRVNINVSAQTLNDSNFLDFVRQCLIDHALSPQKICFEITEYSALNNFTKVLRDIQALRDLGFSFALEAVWKLSDQAKRFNMIRVIAI